MKNLVLLEQIGAITTLTLNRPDRHNSLVPELLEDLVSKLNFIHDNPQNKVVVLKANGRSFSTGGDIQSFYDHSNNISDYAELLVGLLNQTILSMINLPIPVVTAVNGIVTGGSLGLVLASDIVLIAPESSFTPYYGIVGFSPDGGWTALLPSIIGQRRTAEILLNNRTITAQEALLWGLAHQIVPQMQLHEKTLQTAKEILQFAPGTMKSTKSLLRNNWDDLAAKLEVERELFIEQVKTEEAMKGMASFLNLI